MDKKELLETLKKVKKESKKRGFKQSIDISIVLKEVDLNNPDEKIDKFIMLPEETGNETKICALVDKELSTQANEVFKKVITKKEFPKFKNKKREMKKLAREYDYFIAQATIMTDIASNFGKILGTVGKMPNPKAGCIVPPKADLKDVKKKLERTIRLKAKKQPVINALVGKEDTDEEKVVKNAMRVYKSVLEELPHGDQQIKKVILKTTMGKPQTVGD